MPLLAPDVPVVTWWQGAPPDRIAYDPLGVVADRRITDTAQADQPVQALHVRADDYAPGDTDLSWTRVTPWRSVLAGAFDAGLAKATSAKIVSPDTDPCATLLGGWLRARLGVSASYEKGKSKLMEAVSVSLEDGSTVEVIRDIDAGTCLLRRSGQMDQTLPMPRRPLGEELAEELRRLDADEPYASALGAATDTTNLSARTNLRVHVWKDPALAEQAEPANA